MSRILLDSTTCLMCVRGGLLLCVTKTMLPLVQVWDYVYTVHLYVTVLRKPNFLREKYVLWDCNTRMCIYMYTAIFNDVITHFSPLPLSLPLSISLHFHLPFPPLHPHEHLPCRSSCVMQTRRSAWPRIPSHSTRARS